MTPEHIGNLGLELSASTEPTVTVSRMDMLELLGIAAASLAREGEDGELCKALTSYQQADEDGVMVLVSRQACDEAATRIRALASEKEGLRRETGRQCVNCGRWFPKEWDRAKAPDDCKSPDACTIDMTADEAWQHWRKEAHTERARAESSEALVAELREKVERLTKALRTLIFDYVNLLEIGRDRIVSYGGSCDPVDVMEASDPALRRARSELEGRNDG